MNKLFLSLCFISAAFLSCRQNSNCDKLPTQFSSYDEAKSKIQGFYFKIQEEANTSNSSWIKGASFYSCDGTSGYFLLQTDKKEYLYSDMPYSVWTEFKNAESLGTFYNKKIKHNYIFKLTN